MTSTASAVPPKKVSIVALSVLSHLRAAERPLLIKDLVPLTEIPAAMIQRILMAEEKKSSERIVKKQGAAYFFIDTPAARKSHDSMLASFQLTMEQALVPGLSEDLFTPKSTTKKQGDAKPRQKAGPKPRGKDSITSPLQTTSNIAFIDTTRQSADMQAISDEQVHAEIVIDSPQKRSASDDEVAATLGENWMTISQLETGLGGDIDMDKLQMRLGELVDQGILVARVLQNQSVYRMSDMRTPVQVKREATPAELAGVNLPEALMALISEVARPPKYFYDNLPEFDKIEVIRELKQFADSGVIDIDKSIKPIGYLKKSSIAEKQTREVAKQVVTNVSLGDENNPANDLLKESTAIAEARTDELKQCVEAIDAAFSKIETVKAGESTTAFLAQLAIALDEIRESNNKLKMILAQ